MLLQQVGSSTYPPDPSGHDSGLQDLALILNSQISFYKGNLRSKLGGLRLSFQLFQKQWQRQEDSMF